MNTHAVFTTFVAAPADAQVSTSFAVVPGVSTGASETGAAIAGSVSVDVASRLTLEGYRL